VGRFEFRLCAHAPGEVFQTFSLVQEGTTWFGDAPLGGGPPDDQLEVRVLGIDPVSPYVPPPPPEEPPEDPTSTGEPEGASEGAGESGSGDGGDTGDAGGETSTAGPGEAS